MTNGSNTCVLELQDTAPPQQVPRLSKEGGRPLGRSDPPSSSGASQEVSTSLPAPNTATEELQRWNYPKANVYRLSATFWAFLVMGANDAAYGALIPYLESYYDLTYTVVSLVFLSPFAGYTLSALLNNWIHMKFGQRGVAILSPACHLIAYIVLACHPPYPVLVVIFILAGFGNGLADAAWNAWIGNMANANEILGILHGLYGAGGVISPLVATTMITKGSLPWYSFYYCMIGFAALELVSCAWCFWDATGQVYREQNPKTEEASKGTMKNVLFTMPSARVTWLCALFLLGYVGIEVALGGWIVTFMIEVRKGERFASGMTATGFWLGITFGRAILGFITPRIGVKLAVCIYLPLAMALELLFWLVPQFYVSAVAVALQGFFLGPLFPAVVVAATKLLPRHLHVSSIGFAAAFGGSGAAILPFVVGVIAQAKGVQVLQPIILALLGVILILWVALPRFNRKVE